MKRNSRRTKLSIAPKTGWYRIDHVYIKCTVRLFCCLEVKAMNWDIADTLRGSPFYAKKLVLICPLFVP